MTIVQCVYQENGAKAAETTYYDFVAVRLVPLEVSGEDSRILFVDDVGGSVDCTLWKQKVEKAQR